MTDRLFFTNSEHLWLVLILGILLWGFFLWKEWPLRTRFTFYIRAVVGLLILVALGLWYLKPMVNNPVKGRVGILITPGHDGEHLKTLKRNLKQPKILSYTPNERIRDTLAPLDSVLILGDGLATHDLWQLQGIRASYTASPTPEGIIEMQYPPKGTVGIPWTFNGLYHLPTIGNQLVLEDPAGNGLDSIVLDTIPKLNFSLRTTPKVKGRYLYHLVEKDSTGKALDRQPIPVQWASQTPLKILILNGFPSFETKYLKNYLAEAGHALTVRSELSRGKYKFEYFNTQKQAVYRLDKEQLKVFDLLIIDHNSLLQLNRTSFNQLLEAIRDEGLGLFVQANPSQFPFERSPIIFESTRTRQTSIQLGTSDSLKLQTLGHAFPETPLQVNIHLNNAIPVAVYKHMGSGKVGTSGILDSYQLQLKGQLQAYKMLWSSIIRTLSKKQDPAFSWEAYTPFALVDLPYTYTLRGSKDSLRVRHKTLGILPVQATLGVPELWNGKLYPNLRGWQSLEIEGDTNNTHSFYAFDQAVWPSWQLHRQQESNKRVMATSKSENMPTPSPRPISPFWFWSTVLLGLAYLWLVPKLG